MTAVGVAILVAVLIVAGAVLLAIGSAMFRGGTVGPRSIGGRLRGRSERDRVERDHDPALFTPRGGHHADLPVMRKRPNEGGLL